MLFTRSRHVLLAPLLLLIGFCAVAEAQIDLPTGKGKEQDTTKPVEKPPAQRPPEAPRPLKRGIVPHLVCSVCSGSNYTARRDRPTDGGFYWAHCVSCRTDRIHKPSEVGGERGALDLPSGAGAPSPAPAAATGAAEGAAVPTAESVIQQAPQRSRGQVEAANAVFDVIRPVEGIGDPLLEKAIESLIALGEDGLLAARVALHGESAAEIVVATRVLLRGGEPQDALRIIERLRGDVPHKLGPRLLGELIAADPVQGSPELLIQMLEHPNLRMRQASMKELRKRLAPALLPALTDMLASKKAESRLLAVELIASIEDPGVVDILMGVIADPSARVASRVVEALASNGDERVPLELEALAFRSRWILRNNAYALLAIIDREDLTLEAILDERNVEALLHGLQSSDPFIYGACASALAGIGFRARRPEETAWLDRDVTGRLVAVCSGREFHSDFSALLPRALRRLRLITGVDYGSDGPEWARWWIEEREGFYARRIGMSLEGERLGRLEVLYRSTGADSGVFALFAPAVEDLVIRERAASGEVFRVTDSEVRGLAALLEREGVLGPERLPGLRGSRGRGVRTVEVLVDGRGKNFSFGGDVSEPWFERIAAAVRDLRDRNRWQRYPDLERYETKYEFWVAESAWWGGEHSELEQGLRLKMLVLAVVSSLPPSRRLAAIEELERLYEIEGIATTDDFRTFLELVRDEGFYVGRARRLVGLALRSAQAGSGAAEDLPVPDEAVSHETVPHEFGDALLDLLNARFGADAAEDMAIVALACGPDYVREIVADARPLVRAIAATALGATLSSSPAGSPGRAEDQRLLVGMLDDPEPFVEASVCLALGRARVDLARTDLLVRARVGEAIVRSAALRAVGMLGGDFVLEALVLGASAPEAEVRRAAAEGLVALKDPKAAPLLVSMLGRGRESEVYEPARQGLLDLGQAAWPDLERVMNSPVARARREATLLLSFQGLPRSAGVLIGLLEENREDEAIANELAVLTCIDFREADDPVYQWQRWWESVVHDNSLVWLTAAMERRGVEAPPLVALSGRGRRDGALFLLECTERAEGYIAERGRRELSRVLERELDVPSSRDDRLIWLELLRAEIVEAYAAWTGAPR